LSAQIILALDVDSIKKAKYLVHKLYPKVKIFKVGLQLFTLAGPEIIKFIHKQGAEVFLDLKLLDIPNTVAHAVRQAVRLKVKMFTLHVSGGEEMLSAAVRAVKEETRKTKMKSPLLIGVTVLTSKETNPGQVLKLAKIAKSSGLNGVVCSVREASLVRKKMGARFVIVTPGIRPKSTKSDDQKRVATAKEAIKAGSNFLVVGRPILEAKNPLKAAEELV